MNLTCFWSRRACSRYAVLDEPIPPGSKLLTHIEKCDECREYWRSLSLLTTDLELMVDVPSPSSDYLEPIWERVKPAKRALHDWGRLSLAGAAACGLLCGWMSWRLGSDPSAHLDHGRIIKHRAAPDEDIARLPNLPSVISGGPNLSPGPNIALDTGTRMSRFKWTAVVSRHRRHIMRHSAPLPQELDEAAPPTDWRVRGEQLEALGDPGLANAAYQAEYQEHPTEQSAFDMGRSAEESGDMEQAMNVYAGLLDAADARARSEKGWTP